MATQQLTTTVSGNSISVDDNFSIIGKKVSVELDSANPVSVSVAAGSINAPALQTYLNRPEAKAVLAELFSLSSSGTGVTQLSGADVWELTQTGSLTWAFNSNVPYFESLLTGESLTLTYHLVAQDSLGNEITQDIPVQITGETKIINAATQNGVIADLLATVAVEGIAATLTVTTEANTTLGIFDGSTDITSSFSTDIIGNQSGEDGFTQGIWTVIFSPTSNAYYGKNLTVKSTSTDKTTIYDSVSNLVLNLMGDSTAPAAPTITETSGNLSDGFINAAEVSNAKFRVTLPIYGSRAVIGDDVKLFGATSTQSHVLIVNDITNGYVDFDLASVFSSGSDGFKSLTATITDIAGNISSVSVRYTFTLDKTAPAVSSVAVAGANLTDGLNAAEVVAGTSFQVSLPTSSVGDKIELLLDGKSFAVPKITTFNSVSSNPITTTFTVLKTDLGNDGTKSITAITTDIAGNKSSVSSAITFTLDTTAPSVPILTLQETGIINDRITSNGNILISGVDQVLGTTWQYSLDSATTWSSAQSYTSSNLTLTGDGTKNVLIRQINAVGNSSLSSQPLSFILDTQEPAAPTIAEIGTTHLTDGKMNADEAISTNFRVSLQGAGTQAPVVGDTVKLWLNSSVSKTITLGSGNITAGFVDFTLVTTDLGSDSDKSITATVTDAAGNVSSAATLPNFTLITALPIAPTLALDVDTGKAGDKITSVGRVVVSSLGANTTWQYSIDNGSHWTTGSGSKFTVTGDGNKTVLARQTDSAGNISAQNSLSFVLDTNAPITLTANRAELSDSLVNFSEANSGVSFRVNLIGDVVLGDIVSLLLKDNVTPLEIKTINNTNIGLGYVDFSVSKTQLELGSEGTKSITAQLLNAGTTTTTSPIVFTLDTIAPLTSPSIVTPSSLSDSWLNNTESASTFFKVNLPTDAVVGDSVSLLIKQNDSTTISKTQILSSLNISNQSVDFTVLKADLGATDGSKSLTAKVTDIAGNSSNLSTALPFVLDTVAPTSSIATSSFDFWNSSLASKSIQINLGTTATVNDTVKLLLNGVSFKKVTSTISSGSVSIEVLRTDLGSDGVKSLTTIISDVAGNKSSASAALTFTLDSTIPSAPTLSEYGSTDLFDGLMNNAEAATTTFRATLPTLGSRAVAGDKIQLFGATPTKKNGVELTTNEIANGVALTADDITNGYVDFTVLQAGLGSDDVKKLLTSKITDNAGNVGSVSSPITFTLDTTAPVIPTFATVAALSDGKLNNLEAVNTVFQVNLTAAARGDKVELLLKDGSSNAGSFGIPKIVTLVSDITNSSVNFTVTKSDLGADGSKSITAVITDLAGNKTTSAPTTFELKATLPTTPQLRFTDTGIAATDSITNNPLVNVGQLLSGTSTSWQWQYVTDGTNWNTGSGTSFSVTDNGTKSILVRQTDTAGNISNVSNLNFTYDGTKPNTPTLTETTNYSADTFINKVEAVNIAFRVALNSTIANTVNVGDKVELLLGVAPFSTPKLITISDADRTKGYVDFTVLQNDFNGDSAVVNDKSITAKITDIAGNSSTSSAVTFTLDTFATNAPTVAEFSSSKLSDGKLNYNETIANTSFRVALPTSGVAALTGDKVELLLNGASFSTPKFLVLGQGVNNSALDFSLLKADLGADGDKVLTAVITDKAGNTSSLSSAVNFKLKAILPATPAVSEFGTTYLSDNVLNNTESTSVVFQASFPKDTLTVGDKIELLLGASSIKSATLNTTDISNGYANFTVVQTDLGLYGNKVLTAKITDTFGNVSATSKAVEFVLNTSTDTTNFRVELPTWLGVSGNEVELLLDGKSFNDSNKPSSVILGSNSTSVDFKILTSTVGTKKLTSVITDATSAHNRYYLDSSFSVASTGIKTTITTIIAKSSAEVLQSKTVTTVTDDKGYLKTTIQEYDAVNTLSKTTVKESVKSTVTQDSVTTISIDTTGLFGEVISVGTNSQTAYKIIERDGSTTTYYLNNTTDHPLVNYTNTTLNTNTTSVKFYSNVGAFLSRTDTTLASATMLISHYNSANVLTDSVLINGVKTTTKNASGGVINISIDTTTLKAVPDSYDANLVNYTDGNTTYTLDTSKVLVKYSVAAASVLSSGVTVTTSQIYNNLGLKIGDGKLSTQNTHSSYTETTTEQNNNGSTVTNTVINDGYKISSVALYDTGGTLLSSQQIDGIKTTSFNAAGVVTSIAINVGGLNYSTVDGYNVYSVSDSSGSTNSYYLQNNALVKYSSTQTSSDGVNHTIKTVSRFDNLGIFTDKSVSVASTQNGYITSTTKDYNAQGVLTGSSQTDGIKTTIYGAIGNVILISIDTTGLTGTKTTDGTAYTDVINNATYYLNTLNVLTSYSVSKKTGSIETSGSLITNTFSYNATGILTSSSVTETTTQTTTINRYNALGILQDKTEVDGRKTTLYNNQGQVQNITIDVTGLTGTPDAADSTRTNYTVSSGVNTIVVYSLDSIQALVKYTISKTTVISDTHSSLLNVANYNARGLLIGSSSITILNNVEHVTWLSTLTYSSAGKLASVIDNYDNDGVQTSTTKNYDTSGNLSSSSKTEGIKTTFYNANGVFVNAQINVSGLKVITQKVITQNSIYSSTDSNGVETIYTVTTGNILVKYDINQYSENLIGDVTHYVTNTQTFDPNGQLTGSKVTDQSTVNTHNFTTIKQYGNTGLFVSETKIEDKMTTVFDANNTITSVTFDATGLTPESTTVDNLKVYKQESDNGTYRFYLNGTSLTKYSLSTSTTSTNNGITHNTTNTNTFSNNGILTSTNDVIVDSYTTEGVLRTISTESNNVINAGGTSTQTTRYLNDGILTSTTVTNYSATGNLVDKTQTVGHKITAFDSAGKITRVSIDVAPTSGSYTDTSNGTIYYADSTPSNGSYTLLRYSLTKTTDRTHYSTTTYNINDIEIGRLNVDGTKTLETTINYNVDGSRIETITSNIDGHITSSKLTYNGNGVLTEHTETVGIRTDYFDPTTGVLQRITINVTDLTGTSFKDVDTTYTHVSGSNVVTSFQTTTTSDSSTFNNLGVLIAKLHTETGKSSSMVLNDNGTKTITDTTILDGKTFISTVIRNVSDDSVASSSQSDGIKTTFYKAAGAVDHISVNVAAIETATYELTDSSGVKTKYYVNYGSTSVHTDGVLNSYTVTQNPYIYTDATTGKQQTVTASKTFNASNVETGNSILNTVKIGTTEKAWSNFTSDTTSAGLTTTTFLWIDETKKGFSVNQYDASNNNTGSIFAKSVYTSSSSTDLKSVSIDVTKNLVSDLASSDTGGKVTYTVSHTLKTTIDTQTAYGSSLTAASTTTSDVVLLVGTTTRYGVFDLTATKPIHFVDAVTTGVDTEHKIDNWYLSKMTATTSIVNVATGDNKLIEMAAGNYTIKDFKLGDVLYFPSTPTATTLINSSTTDGEIKIDVTFNAVIAHITLTGISNDTDASVGNIDMTNFNTIFGFGTSPII